MCIAPPGLESVSTEERPQWQDDALLFVKFQTNIRKDFQSLPQRSLVTELSAEDLGASVLTSPSSPSLHLSVSQFSLLIFALRKKIAPCNLLETYREKSVKQPFADIEEKTVQHNLQSPREGGTNGGASYTCPGVFPRKHVLDYTLAEDT